jgi:hypothetical protein
VHITLQAVPAKAVIRRICLGSSLAKAGNVALRRMQRSNFDFTGKPDSALDQEQEQESGPKTSNPMGPLYRKSAAISSDN